MLLIDAQELGDSIVRTLAPHCDLIQIAGSVRREKPEPNDIEIVCIPKREAGGLFGDEYVTDHIFCRIVNGWRKVRGEPDGKYTQRIVLGRGGMAAKVDIFMASPSNWGLILAIRTGPAEYSHRVLAHRWKKLGYHSEGGTLYDRYGDAVVVAEESDLFSLLGISWEDPKDRRI